jgi:CoA-transferase family III
MDAATMEDSWLPFQAKISQLSSTDLQTLAADKYRQAGTTCLSASEYFASEHGQANAHVGLLEIHPVLAASQPRCWWPATAQTSAKRPLAGLKVVDLTRVIAAPAVTRGLAELGASVMRVTSPNLTDFSTLHVDLNWGKWNTHLDLKDAAQREQLKQLVRDADVVVQGYRPGVLDKYGFGHEGIIELCRGRQRGVISARENCYGWHGPWRGRSGWQQISDACVGISEGYGRAMGLEEGEPVTPVFPNSDYMTGVAGVVGILCALMRRAEEGGSYKVDLALNYYNQWLARSVGVYPERVWEELWGRNARVVFRAEHNIGYTIPRLMGMIGKNSGAVVLRPEFFEDRKSGALGVDVRTVKPIIRFKGGEVELGYNVGTRGNGVDKPTWPEDLMTEIVK